MVKTSLSPGGKQPLDHRTCSNCDAPVEGAFCGACGQPAYVPLTFRRLFRDSVLRIFDVEAGFLHTLASLSTRPGMSIRQYVKGRRLPFTHPVSYCFVLVTVYALTINLLDPGRALDSLIDFSDIERRVYHIIHGILAYLVFLIFLPVAAIQAALFRRSGFSVADTYAFSLFVSGHVHLASTVFAAAGWLASAAGVAGLIGIQFLYLLWAMTGFYGLSRPPVLRALAVAIANLVIANILSLLVGNLIVASGLLEPLESLLA